MKFLKNQSSILILKSDKGDSLVIFESYLYLKAGNEFLNPNSFIEVSADDNFKNYNKLYNIILNLKKQKWNWTKHL